MNDRILKLITPLTLLLLLFACEKEADTANKKGLILKEITLTPKSDTQRWYTLGQVNRGRSLYQNNCVVCHGANAEATPDWKTPDTNGHYPPPPLNGSAHAWHHPLIVLASTIHNGGQPVGGLMPAFKDQLTESEIIDIIAGFQHYWPDPIYERWLQIENSSRQ